MAVTRERFEQGMSYDAYKAGMGQNKEQFENNERNLDLHAEDLAAFKNLPQPLNVLVIAEDWCGDVVGNLPILGRLARDSGKLNLNVFYRDQPQNRDLMAQYMNGEFESIPVFAFFDDDFNQVGLWIERPKGVSGLREQKRREIYRDNPEFGSPDGAIDELPEETRGRLRAAIRDMRAATVPFSNQEVIRELREVVERVLVR